MGVSRCGRVPGPASPWASFAFPASSCLLMGDQDRPVREERVYSRRSNRLLNRPTSCLESNDDPAGVVLSAAVPPRFGRTAVVYIHRSVRSNDLGGLLAQSKLRRACLMVATLVCAPHKRSRHPDRLLIVSKYQRREAFSLDTGCGLFAPNSSEIVGTRDRAHARAAETRRETIKTTASLPAMPTSHCTT